MVPFCFLCAGEGGVQGAKSPALSHPSHAVSTGREAGSFHIWKQRPDGCSVGGEASNLWESTGAHSVSATLIDHDGLHPLSDRMGSAGARRAVRSSFPNLLARSPLLLRNASMLRIC